MTRPSTATSRLIGGMVNRSASWRCSASRWSASPVWGLTRLPTAFLPIEDQGYMLSSRSFPTAPRWSAPTR